MNKKEFDQLSKWVTEGKHLPPFMRDFYDQKSIFKTIGSTGSPNPTVKEIGWMEGHCYTIDKFLKWMAFQGYTLQKCRAKHPFLDINKTVQEIKDKETDMLKHIMGTDKKDK